MNKRTVIVVGAGPAGLAAALELATAGHSVTVLESDSQYVGGLSRTLNYKGFRFDIGGHRFFSKNPEITQWWNRRLPGDFVPVKRLSRILYRQRFFHYPLLAKDALFGLGLFTSTACVLSYLWRQMFPRRLELSFEDWVINRFGERLYRIFFKTYTEKVWGMPCNEISADWASQRIKGLSLKKAILAALGFHSSNQETIKTLIDEFQYPRHGAGMLWEKTRDEILKLGGRVLLDKTVVRLERDGNRITAVHTLQTDGLKERWTADSVIVSMPLRDCVLNVEPPLPTEAREAARQLQYRDFILVAIIVDRPDLFPDTWIYVHDSSVKVGRIQNYNNWGGEMTARPGASCLELEYFCNKHDGLWDTDDAGILQLAKRELEQLGLAKAAEVVDGCVVRVEKAYPVYDAHYRNNVDTIRKALAPLENLQAVGRNGMHKYNNQDHSILTGLLAARNLSGDRNNVWQVNGDAEYQEEITEEKGRQVPLPLSMPK
ncbi:MAG TPA: NAD(P)/FAD-dependent oxidoreductase [Verrucomicrobiae bacterium]|jgi:protoporphyrinogen oxidase|nr:NAD(P)/FAD-dependent oxidoreductase [Verrucomicrobiae bacterium]